MKIEVQNLRHIYPTGEEALKGLSLVLDGSASIAIIGQNGSGKTTLVKHFNGILRPTSGDVLINGESIGTRSTAKWSKVVGYVFQNPDDQLFLDTVRKELEFGPRKIGMPEETIAKQTELAAKLCGLDKLLDRHPFDLTSTQKKFCTIASIITMNPDALVFDEPTCGQDVRGVDRLCEIVNTLKGMGKLCITISHDMKFVVRNFDRVIVLYKGRVIMDGSAEAVFSRPEEISKSFVSPPPITRVAQGTGLKKTVFTIGAFMDAMKQTETEAAR